MELEKELDPQLWHACAGSMVQMPSLNSKVFYFPQGHGEHSQFAVDFASSPRISALIPCMVASLKFLSDPETDEVFAKIGLVPLGNHEMDFSEESGLSKNGNSDSSDHGVEKLASFAKTLTQSDANNGGGFSVPRYCAETIFPRLDYSADPPVQTLIAKDVHGVVWKFRHIYRGTPRRHLLTTGWSTFVNQKKLVAGDSIVFFKAGNGGLCLGIRRAKRGVATGNGPELTFSPSGWSSNSGNCINPYGGLSLFLKDENKRVKNNDGLRGKGKVRPEEVLEAATRLAKGQTVEVSYYPRAGSPEFFVNASAVRAAMRIQWCSGMRFKMAFETEDSSRVSWFMGTVTSVQVADPFQWPNSPWRLLQVTWDEPDLLQNVKRVNPWLVELVLNVPVIQMSPFSPPRKKLCVPHQFDFPFDGKFLVPSYLGNLLGSGSPSLCSLSDKNAPAGIQGARHTAQFGISLSDLQLNSNKLQAGSFLSGLQRQFNNPDSSISKSIVSNYSKSSNDNLSIQSNGSSSCLLTMGNSSPNKEKSSDNVKKRQFLLFGQPILTEEQILSNGRNSSDEDSDVSLEKPLVKGFACNKSIHANARYFGHCKIFLESEDSGRTLDLSDFGSYEELYSKLANTFGIERLKLFGNLLYRDATGSVKRAGDEPFSIFAKTARRLTVLIDPTTNVNIGKTWFTGIRSAENGLGASNKTGPLSILA